MSKPILPLPSPQQFGASQASSVPGQGLGQGRAADTPQQQPQQAPPPPTKPTYSKRGKITIVACVPCRKRKTKCDGKRPECTQCQSREGACHYDMSEEQRRLTYLRENVEHLAEEKNSLEALLWNLGSSPEDEAQEILRRLRSGTDPQTLVQHIQAGRSLAQVRRDSHPSAGGSSYPALAAHLRSGGGRQDHYELLVETLSRSDPVEVEEIVRRLRAQEDVGSIVVVAREGNLLQALTGREFGTQGIEGEYSSHDQTFGLTRTGSRAGPQTQMEINRIPIAHTPVNRSNSQWTTVTDDLEFIDHLITTYFTWQHSFFQSFPEHLFRQDYASGGTRYCSRFLVNAICAAGCLLSQHPKAQRDPNAPTSGYPFFEEAVGHMLSEHQSSIPSVAGYFLLCHVEGYRGRLGRTWDYSGRSARMALDLNLHLRSDIVPYANIPQDVRIEDRAKLHTFWGCFISDQVTSFTLGRLPQIPVSAITIDLPPISEEEDAQPWVPYGVDDPHIDKTPKAGCRSTTFNCIASLSKIVNSTLLMFFAPTETMRGGLLLEEYQKYQSWFKKLPASVRSIEGAPPHVLCLHMYYHAAVLLLFRPFLKAKFTESSISPSEVCRSAANKISDIFAAHRAAYNTVGLYTFQIHCLLTACTIHLINVPTISSTTYLTTACNHFHDLLPRNEWASGGLSILKGLVQKWSIVLPQEADVALFKNDSEIALPSFFDDTTDPALTSGSRTSSNYADLFRPHKRVAMVNVSPEGLQKRPKLTDSAGAAPTANMGQRKPGRSQQNAQQQNDTTADAKQTAGNPTGGAPPPVTNTVHYLFAPFPNQPAPLLGPIHTSTGADPAWSEEMHKVAQGFDGLTFETGEGSGWLHDPFMGFGTWHDGS